MAKRTKTDIINDMLVAIMDKGGTIKPTHLMYKANLSHNLLKGYLEELVEKEFVEEVEKNHFKYLTLTDKGSEFIERFKKMKEFEKSFGL